MKTKKTLVLVLCMLLCVFTLTGCKKSPIQGSWVDEKGNVYTFSKKMTFTINTGDEVLFGGTFVVDKEKGTVVFSVVAPEGGTTEITGTYDLSVKRTLKLTGSDGSVSTLTRQ